MCIHTHTVHWFSEGPVWVLAENEIEFFRLKPNKMFMSGSTYSCVWCLYVHVNCWPPVQTVSTHFRGCKWALSAWHRASLMSLPLWHYILLVFRCHLLPMSGQSAGIGQVSRLVLEIKGHYAILTSRWHTGVPSHCIVLRRPISQEYLGKALFLTQCILSLQLILLFMQSFSEYSCRISWNSQITSIMKSLVTCRVSLPLKCSCNSRGNFWEQNTMKQKKQRCNRNRKTPTVSREVLSPSVQGSFLNSTSLIRATLFSYFSFIFFLSHTVLHIFIYQHRRVEFLYGHKNTSIPAFHQESIVNNATLSSGIWSNQLTPTFCPSDGSAWRSEGHQMCVYWVTFALLLCFFLPSTLLQISLTSSTEAFEDNLSLQPSGFCFSMDSKFENVEILSSGGT